MIPKTHTHLIQLQMKKKKSKGGFTTGNPILTLQNLCMCVYK